MTSRKVSRIEAVTDQINSAIRVYFLWDNLVSSLTLAGAAERVLSDLQPQDGLFGVDAASVRSLVNLYIRDEHQNEAAALFRKDYDFFRHADRKPQQEYVLNEASVDFHIFIAISSYQFLKNDLTDDMRAFLGWFALNHLDWLKDQNKTVKLQEINKKITKLSKQDYYQCFMRCSAMKYT
jgi:hypothetical protein